MLGPGLVLGASHVAFLMNFLKIPKAAFSIPVVLAGEVGLRGREGQS